ncbi:MAG: phosphatidylglycerol lysyltransferase domain-containing protein [Muribaculaceae bacterium]|nr:phosphatidylglycerol lysyltransferase domain-containing protein [Muribaculaceae bacterium]
MPNLKKSTPEVLVATLPQRLSFRPITPDCIDRLAPYLRCSGSRSCDFTVGGVFMWIDYFGYEYCIYRDTLFLKGLSEDASRRPAFSLPMGALPLREAVAAVRAYCRQEGIAPLFSAVPEERLAEFKALGARAVTPLPDWADYIYRITDLASLTGKHYNKKRNHVNRFVADNPGWSLDDIDASNIAELCDFFAALDIESAKADPAMAEFEREQCLDVLANYAAYPFEGAILRDGDGRIVAFTAGELAGDTLVLHIEKMMHTVAGAGEAINRFFAERMAARHPELCFINREDDAGDPGLRYAKESYRPAFKLAKYNLEF